MLWKNFKKIARKLLIVGGGDVARRTLPRLLGHYQIFALLRNVEQAAFWRAQGVRPILADLGPAREPEARCHACQHRVALCTTTRSRDPRHAHS